MLQITFATQNENVVGVCSGSAIGVDNEMHGEFPWFRNIVDSSKGEVKLIIFDFEKENSNLSDDERWHRAETFISEVGQLFNLEWEGLGAECFGGCPFSNWKDEFFGPDCSRSEFGSEEKLPLYREFCNCKQVIKGDLVHTTTCEFKKLEDKFHQGDEKAAILLARYYGRQQKTLKNDTISSCRLSSHCTSKSYPNFSCIECGLEKAVYCCSACLLQLINKPDKIEEIIGWGEHKMVLYSSPISLHDCYLFCNSCNIARLGEREASYVA